MEEFKVIETYDWMNILQMAGWMGLTLSVVFILLCLLSILKHIKISNREIYWLVNRLKNISDDPKGIPLKKKRGRPKK